MNEAIGIEAALKDMEQRAREEQLRGVSDMQIAEQYGQVPTPGAMERRSFHQAKSAEFICGCSVEVAPIQTENSESDVFIPSERRPYRENLMSEAEKQTARRRLPEIRAILDKDK